MFKKFKTDTDIIVAFTVFLIIFGIFSSFLISRSAPESDPVGSWSCTADYKVCPDGSEVVRVPPYCQFADCPI